MTQQPVRICILGGGFGGLYTALRLSQFPWEKPQRPEIILVDRQDRFVFLPLLYELLTGELQTWEIAPPFEELLANTGVRFTQATVAGIDIDNRRVQLENGPEFPYDRLVLALGGETPLDGVPGVADRAIPFHTLADAYRLEERVRILEESNAEKIRVAIVGGGYSGVELACKLAERLGERGRLRLIEQGNEILRTSSEFNRSAAQQALNDRNVWIDLETAVESIGSDTISLLYKGQVDTIPVDIVLWTVGTSSSPIVRSLPLKQNQRGQLTISPTLQVIDHPEIFALGDLADCHDATGQQVPNTAQSAYQQADYTAWNIWASLTERPLLPFRYQHLGEMMTLGTDNATLTGLGWQLDGPAAHLFRRLAYLYRLPTLDHQLKVGFNWIARPLLDLLSGK
ncbi:MAG TPA: FAD-dependent oxidoreductase [Cyanobacteria bacterium UBA8803]|nr:FAD-dependent oxidoreductase [Cyanobacteria bacterium UBA8803]